MKQRIITGFLMVVALLIVFWIDSYLLNFFILGLVLFVSFRESLSLYGLGEHKDLSYVMVAFYTLSFFTNPIFVGILAILVVASFLAYFKSENLKTILPFIYPAMPVLIVWSIYSEYGLGYLVWLILIVAFTDSGAYFVGKKFGQRQFCVTSANKTIEGVLGGVFLGTIIGSMCGNYIIEDALHAILSSFLVSVFSVFGDLFESYLKRKAGVKDSGDIFPGHGGMLDRIDGYLFAAPALLWAMSW